MRLSGFNVNPGTGHKVRCARPHIRCLRCSAAKRLSEVTKEQIEAAKRVFTEEDYLVQAQSSERAEWASKVRRATGSRHHLFWEPTLDPPALLAQVSVVLVSPRRPVSVGTVARACSCFEVEELRIVQPRCNYITKHSKSASKGAQYIIHRARSYASVGDAVAGFDLSIAFTRWVAGCPNFYDLPALTQHPVIQQLIRQPPAAGPSTPPPAFTETPPCEPSHAAAGPCQCAGDAHAPGALGPQEASQHEEAAAAAVAAGTVAAVASEANPAGSASTGLETAANVGPEAAAAAAGTGVRPVRVALVFGREELGLADEEVAACSAVCSIPIGRLQESLSLSHAVSLALSQLYSARLAHIAAGSSSTANSSEGSAAYVVTSPDGLAAGYDASGKEI